MAASAASAAREDPRALLVAAARGPSSSSSSSSVATSVAEKVLVMTGTVDGPPAESTTLGHEPGQRGARDVDDAGHRDAGPRTSSATATTSLNSPDEEIPTIASAGPSAGG